LESVLSGHNPVEAAFDSYVQLATGLLGQLSGACLFDAHWRLRGHSGRISGLLLQEWTGTLGWNGTKSRLPSAVAISPGEWVTAIPLEKSDTTLLGVFCVQQAVAILPTYPARYASDIGKLLRPLLDCVHRELAAAQQVRERVQTLTERTAELEWLFKVTSHVKGASDGGNAIRELLAAATDRMESALGVCEIPDTRICIEYAKEGAAAGGGWNDQKTLHGVWLQTRQHLLNWASRKNSPLVVNSALGKGDPAPRCKILAVPVARDGGRVIGVLAFYNPPFAANYASRHVYLAKHLGLQAAAVIDMQCDLMTGLYTRSGLEKMHGSLADDAAASCGCVLYLDVDHMHIVNELHGFEIGNELIVRVADLLAPPALQQDALAARLAGDRFIVVLPRMNAAAGMLLVQRIQSAAGDLAIGPDDSPAPVSLSCGVADLVPAPDGLDRAIAAAELACKTAKSRGRNRAELYTIDDASIRRRHDDIMGVGRLRAALKSGRLLLFARPMSSSANAPPAARYQVTLRMRDEEGAIVAPDGLLGGAERYRLLPGIDRWAVEGVLRLLVPHRTLIAARGVGIWIGVAAQSVADPDFLGQSCALLREAALPRGCLTIEFPEQAALEHFAQSKRFVEQLKTFGCRFALGGFRMDRDALMHIRQLEISGLKLAPGLAPAAIRSIVEFANSLPVETIAGSLDVPDAVGGMRRLGIGHLAGDAIGLPEPLEATLGGLGEDESRRLNRLHLEM